MRLPAPTKSQPVRTEQIILFRVSGQLFAVSSASVKEVRSVDTLSGAAKEIAQAGLRKVRHIVQRGEHSLYVVNGAMHFGLPPYAPALVFVLRHTRTALLVDGIEKMTTMTRLQALPHVSGWLSHDGDVIEVLNLNALTPGPNPTILPAPTEALQQEALS
jgi:chemotaxis signal transduction protein